MTNNERQQMIRLLQAQTGISAEVLNEATDEELEVILEDGEIPARIRAMGMLQS